MTSYIRRWGLAICLVALLLVGACTGNETTAPEAVQPTNPEEVLPEPEVVTANTGLDIAVGLPRLEGTATVVLQVNGSSIVIEVDGDHAPVTAGNFVDLVQRGVYDNLVFHRVVREPEPFVVQGGDPQSADPSVPPQMLGTGSFIDPETQESRLIPLEIQPEGADQPLYGQTLAEARVAAAPILSHRRGAVAMARSQAPNSASSQFYITLAELPFLDGSYAVFGYVTEGMEAVDQIQQGDVIESAEVTAGGENLKEAG
ncbi:peptidylprolyl isomerase [Leptolyngbya sp. PCC 6406]|uniref:peptidylprolyl isomerase n=1 Tax=Leptolyngbya sp. PCC 6406 TaxID=1173264 RepID=UPI0002ABB61B|nr:peptidylprolyl isomerase [Leptolyngbya sp. PCC 6406]